MRFPLSPARFAALALLVVLVLAGCGQDGNAADNGDDEDDDPLTFAVGTPLDDSTTAIVVTSEYGTDTLATAAYMQEVRQRAQRIPPQMQDSLLPQLHRQLVRQFAVQHVLAGESEALDVQADTAEVSRQIETIVQRNFQGDRAAFRERLQAMGLTVDSLREMQSKQMQMRLLQEQYAEEAEMPTSEEVAAYREEQRQEEVAAQHILFRVAQDAPESTVDSVRQVAEAVLDSAEQGADFAELARRHSEGPTASRGGDLGYFEQGRMVPAFDEAVFALEDSSDLAPDPVRTRFGFHVIRLTGRRLQEPMDSTQAVLTLKREKQSEALRAALNELMSKATVHVNPAIVEADLSDAPSAN
jgi:peptidyl-prolyl cis-trans isomerase C